MTLETENSLATTSRAIEEEKWPLAYRCGCDSGHFGHSSRFRYCVRVPGTTAQRQEGVGAVPILAVGHRSGPVVPGIALRCGLSPQKLGGGSGAGRVSHMLSCLRSKRNQGVGLGRGLVRAGRLHCRRVRVGVVRLKSGIGSQTIVSGLLGGVRQGRVRRVPVLVGRFCVECLCSCLGSARSQGLCRLRLCRKLERRRVCRVGLDRLRQRSFLLLRVVLDPADCSLNDEIDFVADARSRA